MNLAFCYNNTGRNSSIIRYNIVAIKKNLGALDP
jgi:hypothetical protein